MHKRMGYKADGEFLNNYSNQRAPAAVKKLKERGCIKGWDARRTGNFNTGATLWL